LILIFNQETVRECTAKLRAVSRQNIICSLKTTSTVMDIITGSFLDSETKTSEEDLSTWLT